MSSSAPTQRDPVVDELARALATGRAICEYSDPALHRVLADSEANDSDARTRACQDQRQAVEDWLAVIGRTLRRVGSVYYAGLVDFNDEARQIAQARFAEYARNALTLCEFFEMIRECRPGEDAVAPGDRILLLSQIMGVVVASPQLQQRLQSLASRVSRSHNPKPEQALRVVVDTLVKWGYLVEIDDGDEYVITGELVLFEQWRDAVIDSEDIDVGASEQDESEARAAQDNLF